jgi:hypothetical protein
MQRRPMVRPLTLDEWLTLAEGTARPPERPASSLRASLVRSGGHQALASALARQAARQR